MNTTISFTLTDPASLFTIDASTGAISTVAAISSSMTTTFTIRAKAEAEKDAERQVTLEVNLTNTDDVDLETFETKAVTYVSAATDSDGDTVSLAETAAAVTTDHGSYTVSSAGMLTYTPDDDFTGTDTFTIDIVDEHGAEGTATVNVRVAAALGVDGQPAVRENVAETLPDNRLAGAVSGKVISKDPARDLSLYMVASVNSTTVTADDTAINATYGTITFDRDGAWRYVLDNSNASVNALDGDDDDTDGANGTLTETITVSMARADDPLTSGVDESETLTRSFSITIHGVTDTLGPDDLLLLTADDDYYVYQDDTITLPGLPRVITTSGDDIFDSFPDDADTIGGSIDAGAGDDIIYGNTNEGLFDIKAGAGEDIIFGGPKIDSISGGTGNDIIHGGNSLVGEADGDIYLINPDNRPTGENTAFNFDFGDSQFWGFDRETSSWKTGTGAEFTYIRAWFDLDRDGVQDADDEYDYLKEIEKINFAGIGDANDTITGGPDIDTINSGDGADTIDGGGGQDILIGGDGVDVITGGSDVDTITLWKGDDIVLYDHDLHQSGTNHVDIITDFSRGTKTGHANPDGATAGGYDRIRLSNTTDAAAYLAIFDTLQMFPGHFKSGPTNDEALADTLIYRSHDDGVLTLAIVLEDYTETITIDHFDLDAVPDIDRKPTKIALTPTSVSLDEGAIAADTTISTISVTDDGKGTNIPVIDGYISWARIGKATIKIGDDGNTLMLAAGSVLDYEDIPGGQITLTIKTNSTGIGLEPSPVTFTLTVNDVDERPKGMTLSPAAWTLNDHTLASSAIKLSTVTFDDDALGTNTFSISNTEDYEIREGNEIWLKAKDHLDKSSGPHTLTVTPSTTGTGEELAAQTFTLTIDKKPTGLSYVGHKVSFAEGRFAAEKIGTLGITDDGYGDVKLSLVLRVKGSFSNRLTNMEDQFEFRDGIDATEKELWLKENAFIDYEPTSDAAGVIEVFLNYDYTEGTTGIGNQLSSMTHEIAVTDVALSFDASVGTTQYPNIIQLPSSGLSAGYEIGSITTSGPSGQTITTTIAELDEDGNAFSEVDRIFNLDDNKIKLRVDLNQGSTHTVKFTTSTEGEDSLSTTINIAFNDIVVDSAARLYLGVESTDLEITLQNDNIPSTSEVDKSGDGDLIKPQATAEDIDTDNGTYSAVDGTGTYTPDTNFTGLDTFEIPVHDGRGGTGTKRISVNVQKGAKDKRSFSTVRDDAPIQDPINIAIARAIGVVELDSSIEDQSEYSLYKGEKKITDFVGNLFTGTYGQFSIRPNGQWHYDLNINNEEVNELAGDNRIITDENSLKDTLEVEFRRVLEDGSILRFGYVIEITILGTANISASLSEKETINFDSNDDFFLGMCATEVTTVYGDDGDDIIDASHRGPQPCRWQGQLD